jgi:transposase
MTWAEMPRSPGHVFYDRLQKLFERGQLRRLGRANLQTVLRAEDGRAIVGPYFRMHMIGYFEGR